MRSPLAWAVGAALLLPWSCGEPDEAPRVDLPVRVDASGLRPVTTDLGYAIELTGARVAVRDVVFTIAGEAHVASRGLRLSGRAHAHPGHYQGGDVTGELPGRFVIDWIGEDDRSLGIATLIQGTYTAANFTFDRGAEDLLEAGDPLIGHTALFAGTATREGATLAFTIVVDSPADRVLVGAPFEATVGPSTAAQILFRLLTEDPLEGDTLFDGLDFAALDADGDGTVRIEPDDAAVEDAYNVFRRTFQTHDHHAFGYQE